MEGKHTKPALITLELEEGTYKTQGTRKFALRKPYEPINPNQVTAFIPGTITEVFVKQNQKVKKGDVLLILNAMKMENQLAAPCNGTVKKLGVKKGDTVTKNQLLAEVR